MNKIHYSCKQVAFDKAKWIIWEMRYDKSPSTLPSASSVAGVTPKQRCFSAPWHFSSPKASFAGSRKKLWTRKHPSYGLLEPKQTSCNHSSRKICINTLLPLQSLEFLEEIYSLLQERKDACEDHLTCCIWAAQLLMGVRATSRLEQSHVQAIRGFEDRKVRILPPLLF